MVRIGSTKKAKSDSQSHHCRVCSPGKCPRQMKWRIIQKSSVPSGWTGRDSDTNDFVWRYVETCGSVTYFLLLELEQGDAVCEQLDVVLGALLGRSLAGQSVADLHAVVILPIATHLVAIILVIAVHHLLLHLPVLVLLVMDAILVHLFVVQFLLLRAPFAHLLLSSCTLRSHLLLLRHHL